MKKEIWREGGIILIASLILGLAVSFLEPSLFFIAVISFLILISLNVLAKKIYAYYLEADTKTKFWAWYQYGFAKKSHFKKPLPMFWLPLALSLLTTGFFWWLAILEFDVKPRVERISRKHGLYRFSEMTDWHVALIATAGIFVNIILATIGYFIGFETFARLNLYFAAWSIIPLSNLDGSKILFGSKVLWFAMLIIISIFLGYSFMVV